MNSIYIGLFQEEREDSTWVDVGVSYDCPHCKAQRIDYDTNLMGNIQKGIHRNPEGYKFNCCKCKNEISIKYDEDGDEFILQK